MLKFSTLPWQDTKYPTQCSPAPMAPLCRPPARKSCSITPNLPLASPCCARRLRRFCSPPGAIHWLSHLNICVSRRTFQRMLISMAWVNIPMTSVSILPTPPSLYGQGTRTEYPQEPTYTETTPFISVDCLPFWIVINLAELGHRAKTDRHSRRSFSQFGRHGRQAYPGCPRIQRFVNDLPEVSMV